MSTLKTITIDDLAQMEKRTRATFINSLGGFKSLALIGTKSKSGQTNLAVFNSLFHLGANPAMFGFIVRPDSVDRHTLNNIRETRVFTVNHVTEAIYKKAHQTSARYPENISEFDATELTVCYDGDFYAPFVSESYVRIAAELTGEVPIEENGTIMVIAKYQSIVLPENSISPDGFVDLNATGTITCAGLDAYYRTELIGRLSYAKPDKLPEEIRA
jgi:flavin reductase (DIM6/NTAB) family NADH-FMN oxidoreductase RutF